MLPVDDALVGSGDGSSGDSFNDVGVIGVVTTASGGGMSFRLNFADGPRRSRIFADEVLGELGVGSGNDEFDGVVGRDGLSRSMDAERCGKERAGGGGGGNGRAIVRGDIRLFVGTEDADATASDGDMSEAGTGGGGGCSAAGNCLKKREESFLPISFG